MKALCQAGSYSPTGMEPCFPCGKGYYQDMEGQHQCRECSPKQTTPAEGSKSSSQCAGIKINEGLRAKRAYIGFWADFHFLQVHRNCRQRDLF